MTERRPLMTPLAAVTPPRHMAHLVASRSYLSYQKDELRDKLKHNPYSYIQVINPDASRDIDTPRGTPAFFEEVRAEYDAFKSRGWLVGAEEPEWLVYKQSTSSHSWTGVVCNLDLARCAEGGLRTHEQTLASRETLFTSFLDAVGFHAEPVLCAKPQGSATANACNKVMAETTSQPAHTDFMTADGVRHEIWRVPMHSPSGKAFSDTWGCEDVLYLADGHHRLASSHRLHKARPDLPGAAHILALVVPEEDLTILGFHKEVRDISMTRESWREALASLQGACDVAPSKHGCDVPHVPGQITLAFQGESWTLTRRPGCDAATDADWVNVHILGNILGIADARNDKRLQHLPEPQRPEGGWQAKAAAHPDRILVLIHPIPFSDIRAVADAGGTLPPKSTWVEPKIRSALFIHEFNAAP